MSFARLTVSAGYENALFKSFPTREEAQAWLAKQNTRDNPILLSSPAASPTRQPAKKKNYVTSTAPSSERFLVAPTPSPEPEEIPTQLDTPPPAYSSPAESPVASTSKLPIEASETPETKVKRQGSRSPEPARKRRKVTPDQPHAIADLSLKLPTADRPKIETRPRTEEPPIVLTQQQQEILGE